MCDNEPKATEKPPFQAGSDFNALAYIQSAMTRPMTEAKYSSCGMVVA